MLFNDSYWNRKFSKRYKKINGKNIIGMNARTPDHLFDGRDPAPFREKDLDEDAEVYILNALRELPESQPVQLRIYFTQSNQDYDKDPLLKEAIHKYFSYEAEMKKSERKHIIRIALRALVIGLSVLFASVYFNQLIHPKGSLFLKYLSEGLQILGWYSMWKPIYFALYEWWPILDEELLLKRASEIEIEIIHREEEKITSEIPLTGKTLAPSTQIA